MQPVAPATFPAPAPAAPVGSLRRAGPSAPTRPPFAAMQQEAPARATADGGADPWLQAVVLALLGFGAVMVYSASAVYAAQKFGAADHFLRREILWCGLGLLALEIASRVDYAAYRKQVYPLLGLSLALLVAVLLVGARINGARRWFHLLGVSFQPAELAKLAVVLYLSHSLSRKADKVKSFSVGFVPHMAIAGLAMLLLLKQPDLGTAVILGLTTLILMFVAGARVSYLVLAVLAAAPVVYQVIVATPFRLKRMLAYLDPFLYRYDVGYQMTESLISIGSGGVFGLGLGDGKQKLFFLPEAHTDYILAIVGEELGLVGLCCVAAAFALLVWRGTRAALRARDAFGCYLAFGITTLLSLQALVNLGVVLGSLPTKGLPLPFVSFGGSTLVVDLFAAGILLNISRAAPEPQRPLLRSPFAWLPALLAWQRDNRRRGQRVTIEPSGTRRPAPPAAVPHRSCDADTGPSVYPQGAAGPHLEVALGLEGLEVLDASEPPPSSLAPTLLRLPPGSERTVKSPLPGPPRRRGS
jgi:cell division protein FtsW